MDEKQQVLDQLHAEFERWDALLAGLPAERAAQHLPDDGFSVKDTIAHLYAWQQVSMARLHAAQHGHEPIFPVASEGLDIETENDIDAINAWFQARYRDWPWEQVHAAWREQFLRLMEQGASFPSDTLTDAHRFPWMHGYPLLDVLQGTYEHHDEHFAPVRAVVGGA